MKNNHGKVTIKEDGKEREIAIVDYSRFEFKDNRFVTILETEEKTYIISVENLPSTGRCPIQKMHLTEESLIGILTSALQHLTFKGVDLEELMKNSVGENELINYKTTIGLEDE